MKKVLSIVLATVLALGAACMVGCANGESGSTNGGTPNNNASVRSVRMVMGSPMTLTASDGTQYVEKTLTATVLPSTADQRVDFSVAWGAGAALASESVTDYVTVTQTTDGSTSAKVRCYKNFGEDTVVITCRTRDGGFSDTCNVTFVGFCSDVTIDASGAGLTIKTNISGEYYELKTGTTYNIPIKLGNIFGYVGTSDLSVSLGGLEREIYFEKGVTNSLNRKGTLETYSLNELAGEFLSASIEGDYLTVTTSDKYVFSGDYIEEETLLNSNNFRYNADLDASYTWTYKGSTVQDVMLINNDNAIAVTSAYFTITVTDNITSTAQTIKVWVESSVSDVNLDNGTLQF